MKQRATPSGQRGGYDPAWPAPCAGGEAAGRPPAAGGASDVGGPTRESVPGVRLADLPGLLRRARRLGDLSQRDLAARLGVSASVIGDIEAGRREASLRVLLGALELGGIRLMPVDAAGAVVPPMREDALRDAQGRRYPAHLDVTPADPLGWPAHWGAGPRRDRARSRVQALQRAWRDSGGRGARPTDHPTAADVEAALTARAELRRSLVRRPAAHGEHPTEHAMEHPMEHPVEHAVTRPWA